MRATIMPRRMQPGAKTTKAYPEPGLIARMQERDRPLGMESVDPTTKGALIGAGATAMGGAIAWIGARAQAQAALKAMTVQVRAQRLDGMWNMRRAAYAEFLDSAESLRGQIGRTYGLARGWQGAPSSASRPEQLAESSKN
ncbi:hypothetical protein GCM10010271_55930 [Streptomyces kurssanovii]|nr:hypothetical protein GCM10010271_55930 [Streptomyces kurssanovii]